MANIDFLLTIHIYRSFGPSETQKISKKTKPMKNQLNLYPKLSDKMIFTYGSLTVHIDVKFKTSKTEKHRNTHLSIQLHSITNLSERCHII